MILHVPCLPHTQLTDEYLSCAYTQKLRKQIAMLRARGYDVRVYEYENHAQYFDAWDQTANPDVDWDWTRPWWVEFNAQVAEQITDPGILCLIAGLAQKPIADARPDLLCVEWGIGYEGCFADYRVYESEAWRHYIHGLQGNPDGRFFDAVIPNAFDPDLFDLELEPDGYLAYLGRMTVRKGPHVAVDIAARAGLPLVMAGTGDPTDADGVPIGGDHVTHIGPLGAAQRSKFLGHARALLVPTTYLGPFEGVAVEAMLCGTPVISTDFGAFTETVQPGVSGYRFNTIGEAADQVQLAGELDRAAVRRYALDRYSLDVVAGQYDRYFQRLDLLWADGFYS